MKSFPVLSAKDPDLEIIISPVWDSGADEYVYRFDFSFEDVHLFRFGSFSGFRGRYYGAGEEALSDFAHWLVKNDQVFFALDPQTTLVSLCFAECIRKARLRDVLHGIAEPVATEKSEDHDHALDALAYQHAGKGSGVCETPKTAELSLSDFKIGQRWRTRKGKTCKIISITKQSNDDYPIRSDLHGEHWHFPGGRSMLGEGKDYEDDLIQLISEEDVLDASAYTHTGKGSGEQDPNGIDQHSPGSKLDAYKTKPDLVLGGFARALNAVAQVGTYGAIKYTPNGWRVVPDGIQRYSDAMIRHYLAEDEYEKKDLDSNFLHAAHLAWNALARLELILQEMEG